MSRRAIVLVVLAAGSLNACSESITAPVQKTIVPSAGPSYGAAGAGSTGTCRGGWVSSEGRC
jgi:hypothetical protein